LLKQYTNDPVDIFIPPHNELSSGAAEALASTDFSIVSSRGDQVLDYDTASFNFLSDTFVPANSVIDDCNSRFELGDSFCVIMLHPQDFADGDAELDESRYAEYGKILAWITEQNLPVVSMSQAARKQTGVDLVSVAVE
jgi:hypothetical protein